MTWDFFERKVCLSLDVDWPTVSAELERVGMQNVERFVPISLDSHTIVGPHQSFNASTQRMLLDFMDCDARTCLIMEGDCIFKDFGHLEAAISELPLDWDILYLGGNVLEFTPERVSEHLFRVRGCWTTHAIAYSRRPVPFLLENQPGFSEEMYDNWLSKQLANLNAYIVAPTVAWQRSHYSGIWGRNVDYDDIFRESDKRLRWDRAA